MLLLKRMAVNILPWRRIVLGEAAMRANFA